MIPSYALSTALTSLATGLSYSIDPTAPIKIQLPWNFGDFLVEVPRRLGCNKALDAASEALVTAYTNFLRGGGSPTPEVLRKNGNALLALRQCLDDPVKAYESETLCSTMILMIIQVGIQTRQE